MSDSAKNVLCPTVNAVSVPGFPTIIMRLNDERRFKFEN